MKSALTEGKFLLLTLLAIFLLIGLHFYQNQVTEFYNPDNFLGIHIILEFFSISISAAILLYGLKTYGKTRSSRMLYLSFVFFLIGTVDLLHTISFKGMPHFITDSSVAKAAWFWVIARVLESFLLLSFIIIPNRKLKRDYRIPVLALVMILAAAVAYIVFHYEKPLPLLVVEGKGTTFLKNMIEYSVSFLHFLAIIITLTQYYFEKNSGKLTITSAFVFLLLSELIFTTYQSIYDFESFTGHLYKAIGYFFILKSIYFTAPASEYETLAAIISDFPGFIFKLEIRRSDCNCTFCDGKLLGSLGLISKNIITKAPFSGIFKITGQAVKDFCMSGESTSDKKMFTASYKDKNLLISIKRYPVSDGIRTVVGTVVELQQEEEAAKNAVIEPVIVEKFSRFHYRKQKNLSEV